jgi:hypothetical protein
VAALIAAPVATLLDPPTYEYERRSHPHRGAVAVHYFRLGAVTVWGATARMLAELLERGFGWTPPTVDE